MMKLPISSVINAVKSPNDYLMVLHSFLEQSHLYGTFPAVKYLKVALYRASTFLGEGNFPSATLHKHSTG